VPVPAERIEPQPAAQPAPVPAIQPGPTAPASDLLTAFLTGLGSGDSAQVKDPAAFLRDAGALLRAVTAGLTATMMARSHFKSELRLGVTTIRRAENNPFKFSVSPEEAMERLLLRPNPAYMPPLDAAREAFDDIQAHEMAMIAGLRAALRALLARFEPSALEARLDTASGLDKLLPMARKSRYWDQFTQTYGQVAADAAEDFMQLFGEAFTRAYEDQILRLAQARGRRQP
jgi:type VI secretion system FHA domain protein